jgi:hypothetical protein
MSKLARACILGAMLAAINLAGMTAVAQAQANDGPAGKQDVRRPPTEGQVGESWRHRQVASDEPTSVRDARRPPLEGQVGESWRHGARVSQEQTTEDAALRRLLAREQFSTPSGTPAQVPAAVRPAEPGGQPGWLVPGFGVLAAALALVAGLAVMAAKRARRKVPARQAG